MKIEPGFAAIILAGGKGTRMGELTEKIPKPLLPIAGRPMIDYLFSSLQKGGVAEIHVVVSHLKNQWYNAERYQPRSSVSLVDASHCSNMVSSFLMAAQLVKERNIIGISGDVFFHESVIPWATQQHKVSGNQVSLFLQKLGKQRYKRWNWIVKGGRLIDIEVSPDSTGYEKYLVIMDREVLSAYTNNFSRNIGKDESEFIEYSKYQKGWIFLLKRLCEQSIDIGVYYSNEYLQNINSPGDIVAVEKHLNASKL
ncbi:MAG: NTP transferase domain-containing protein [Desulfobacteraceae bacterium]|nr:NTP transferase domain-containing protein [Desulfobacteraceae bacterium]MBC2756293.1 NTP transferase domain-containing protein [Desulfobacteraceae bacterium]